MGRWHTELQTNERREGEREGGKQQVGEELANPRHTVAYNVDKPKIYVRYLDFCQIAILLVPHLRHQIKSL